MQGLNSISNANDMIRLLSFNWVMIIYVCLLNCSADPGDFFKKKNTWFASDEAGNVTANILSYQSDLGGWPKNISTTDQRYEGDRLKLKPTFDNGATIDELRFLARRFNTTQEPHVKTAFIRGLNYILSAQYPNGGWPQFHPPGNGYHRHITFNDHAMVRILEFLREISTENTYQFVDPKHREHAIQAFESGIDCILKCQITFDGQLTAWCAQHDEINFQPQSARSYELPTLSGSESVGITRLLMSIDSPSHEMILAIESAVAWFKVATLEGIRLVTVEDKETPKGYDRVIVKEKNAPPLWARFYSLETLRPIFVDRDGVPKASLAEIGYERRNGYAWYGNWPQRLIEQEYPAWKQRVQNESSLKGLPAK